MRIYTKVVADLFHHGHVALLRAARELGAHLTVCVVPDERVAVLKQHRPIMRTDERALVVSACRYVDAVITDGPRQTTLAFMRAHDFAIYAFGGKDDAELQQKRDDCTELPESMIHRLPYTGGVSTSDILRRVLEERR